ncbi:unnamed protein product [Ilex paraguariensis]|uniref:Bifunctional inhibitor/plant lipid transfer protein/seed storage helical domain-containing protein n=1 Tax=Ilex paraguariensis TaxID=185542 RepID=A0ABC8SC52_9AQUA
MAFSHLVPALAVALMIQVMPVYGQTRIPCMASLVTSFTPCMNLLTNSTYNGISPTADCCNSLRSLMGNGMDCLCLLVTANAPWQIPINRTVAMSLPRACNLPGVPVQCEAMSAPIPAPGPEAFGPIMSPTASAFPNPADSTDTEPMSPTLAPEADTTPDLSPPPSTFNSQFPTENSGIRPDLTSSAANPSHKFSPSVLLAAVAAFALKYY